MEKKLTARQKGILLFIADFLQTKGYPPSVREIGEAIGLRSPSTVHSHLRNLQDAGYIRKNPEQPRTIEILPKAYSYLPKSQSQVEEKVVEVPVLGQITAGAPILAYENIQFNLPLPLDFIKGEKNFILHIEGYSMVNAGILPGDLAVIRQQETAEDGDIIVALLDDEVTLKRFYKENGTVRLQPENDSMEPVYSQDVKILGILTTIIRQY